MIVKLRTRPSDGRPSWFIKLRKLKSTANYRKVSVLCCLLRIEQWKQTELIISPFVFYVIGNFNEKNGLFFLSFNRQLIQRGEEKKKSTHKPRLIWTFSFLRDAWIILYNNFNIILLIRSTPRLDGYWGGKNDLIAAIGFEKDGVTTIAFRKKLKGDFYALCVGILRFWRYFFFCLPSTDRSELAVLNEIVLKNGSYLYLIR